MATAQRTSQRIDLAKSTLERRRRKRVRLRRTLRAKRA
jgi:hypothetical protein